MEAQGPDHGYQVKMEQMGEQGTPVQHYHGPEHLLFGRISQSTAKVPEMPMQARYEDGAEFRWLNKKVLDSRVLDSMEGLSTWSFTGAGEMTLAGVHIKDGRRSLRIRSTTNVAQVDGGGEWEDLVATRKFPGEDWSRYNRISLWVYPEIIGAPAISCSLMLRNDGSHKLPDPYNEGRHESIILKNHVWNHVVWEIAPLDRDRVTALDFAYSLPKKLPEPGDQTILDIDQLELQSVVADHVAGWDARKDCFQPQRLHNAFLEVRYRQ